MKKFLIMNIILIANLSFATAIAPAPSEEAFADAQIDPTKLPALGSCDPYSDYYIYQCKPFKCKLPIANMPAISREMEVIGYDKDLCLFNYKTMSRNPNFPPSDLKKACRLSEKGRLEMANQFTQYKKGKTEFYSHPPVNDVLGKECSPY